MTLITFMVYGQSLRSCLSFDEIIFLNLFPAPFSLVCFGHILFFFHIIKLLSSFLYVSRFHSFKSYSTFKYLINNLFYASFLHYFHLFFASLYISFHLEFLPKG